MTQGFSSIQTKVDAYHKDMCQGFKTVELISLVAIWIGLFSKSLKIFQLHTRKKENTQ